MTDGTTWSVECKDVAGRSRLVVAPLHVLRAGAGSAIGAIAMSDPRIEIPAVCEVHGGCGALVIRCERDRLVLDGRADQCCVIALEGPAVTLLFDALGALLG